MTNSRGVAISMTGKDPFQSSRPYNLDGRKEPLPAIKTNLRDRKFLPFLALHLIDRKDILPADEIQQHH
ncbi:hypothetical protein PGTUg99_026872 [Puccinia graminis f. sp. tritici]|uniref:Uncharacterized protein n=1 Tax=Puccinia graminis f. sp. tritici TaxID=56615 RepID=A0A5B0R5W8_PUCGR|nr:hypothetical protein PGTUg99_026872 [Puccinia graminis f. sp. tritici]